MNTYINLLQELVGEFANSSEFSNQISEIFGANHDYTSLQRSWLNGEFTLPNIDIVNSVQINGANGAYSQETNRIYISQQLLDYKHH